MNGDIRRRGFEPRRESSTRRRLWELEGLRRNAIRNPIARLASCASLGIEQYISSGGWKISTVDQSLRDAYPLRPYSVTPKPPELTSFNVKPRRRKYSGNSE